MTDITNSEQIKNYIDESANVAIFVATKASKEKILSALALSHILEKKEKNVSLYCESTNVDALSQLDEIKKIKEKVAPQDLVISLGYGKEEIEKVGYDTKEGQFTLVVTPKKGRIDPSRITFGNASVQFDLIITIGAQDLEDLGDSYLDNPESFIDKRIINIDNHDRNSYFGSINEVSVEKALVSEMMFALFKGLDIAWSAEIANLLLMGLYLGTNSFRSPEVTSETFMAVSSLLNKGANVAYVTEKLYSKNQKVEEETANTENIVAASSLDQSAQPTPFLKPQEGDVRKEEERDQNQANF